jgi:CRP/FNR family transcriptional regulator, cyclic AMP receptor protein
MPELPETHHILHKVQLFAGLAPEELRFVAERAVARSYAPGEIVFTEGEPCSGLYVVSKGSVRIFKTSPGGREQILSIDGPGSSIAELPVFDGGTYPASVAALTASVLLFIAKKDFHALCLQHPEVALKVIKVVGGRLRRLVGIIEELSFTTVRQRLAAHLLRLAESEGSPGPEGVVVPMAANQQEMASHIGTVRELVSRNLSRLQAEGTLRLDGKELVITDMKALRQEAEASS